MVSIFGRNNWVQYSAPRDGGWDPCGWLYPSLANSILLFHTFGFRFLKIKILKQKIKISNLDCGWKLSQSCHTKHVDTMVDCANRSVMYEMQNPSLSHL